MKELLDKQPYVSLSRERALEQGLNQDGKAPAAEDNAVEKDEEEMSLFDLHMPGVLTLEELNAQVDLDHWLLYIQNRLVEMIVSFD